MSQTATLADELGRAIRAAAKDPDDLAGTIPVLASFHAVAAAAYSDESEIVQHVLHELIPDYLERLPNNTDSLAIGELFTWEDEYGNPRTLQDRYAGAIEHVKGRVETFGKRKEPRLLKICAKHFLQFNHEDRVNSQAPGGTAPRDDPRPAVDVTYSPLAAELLRREQQRHESRLAGLSDGMLTVVSQEEMLDALAMITRSAQFSLRAVDHIAMEQWFGNPRLTEYLNLQMALASAGTATVERIRFITDAHMGDARERQFLRQFVRRHDEAGALLLLCPEEGAKRLETIFFPRMGLLLVDPDGQAACLAGRLGDAGYIERSQVYLKLSEPVREALRDFGRLKEYVETNDHDRMLRQQLAADATSDDAPPPTLDGDPDLARQPLADPIDE